MYHCLSAVVKLNLFGMKIVATMAIDLGIICSEVPMERFHTIAI